MPKQRCNATTAKNTPCKAWAIPGTDKCAAHSKHHGGAPPGNTNRRTHGFYSQPVSSLSSIDDIVTDALEKQTQLSAFIEQQITAGDADIEQMAKLLALHGQNASRIGRLLRDRRALSGKSADGLLDAIGQALDEIATELGITV